MKLMPWRFFTIFVAIISTPLLLIVFLTLGQEKFHVLDTVCIFVLIAIALTGAMRGFVNYVVKRKSSPFADALKSAIGFKKSKSVITITVAFCLLCLSIALELYFALTIFTLSSSSGEIEIYQALPFKINKPGVYTLWVNWGEQITGDATDAVGQFQIKQSGNNEVVPSKVRGGESIYRRNGENFYAVCDYAFLTSHSYVLSKINKYKPLSILLRPKISSESVIVAFCCFFSGALLAFIAGYLFLLKKQT